MIKVCVFLTAIFYFTLLTQAQDSTNFITIPSSYSYSMEKPLLIHTGEFVKFEADSIYLVNKVRLAFYEELRNKLLTLDINCEPVIELYKSSLNQNTLLVDQLLENSESTNRLNRKFINEGQLLLKKQNETLDLTLTNLNSAKENLILAKEELSRMRSNNIFENILYTLAGIGIGVIIGISLN